MCIKCVLKSYSDVYCLHMDIDVWQVPANKIADEKHQFIVAIFHVQLRRHTDCHDILNCIVKISYFSFFFASNFTFGRVVSMMMNTANTLVANSCFLIANFMWQWCVCFDLIMVMSRVLSLKKLNTPEAKFTEDRSSFFQKIIILYKPVDREKVNNKYWFRSVIMVAIQLKLF